MVCGTHDINLPRGTKGGLVRAKLGKCQRECGKCQRECGKCQRKCGEGQGKYEKACIQLIESRTGGNDLERLKRGREAL